MSLNVIIVFTYCEQLMKKKYLIVCIKRCYENIHISKENQRSINRINTPRFIVLLKFYLF